MVLKCITGGYGKIPLDIFFDRVKCRPALVLRSLLCDSLQDCTYDSKHYFEEEKPLPIGYHYLLFPDTRSIKDISKDGLNIPRKTTPKYFRRMITSGSLVFKPDNPLLFGQEVKCHSYYPDCIINEDKDTLSAVIARYIYNEKGLSIHERSNIVYFSQVNHDISRNKCTLTKDCKLICNSSGIDSLSLFRFSALTFNSHRIHWDLDYATRVENFSERVVPGNFIISMILHVILRDHFLCSTVTRIEYKFVNKIYCNESINFYTYPRNENRRRILVTKEPHGLCTLCDIYTNT